MGIITIPPSPLPIACSCSKVKWRHFRFPTIISSMPCLMCTIILIYTGWGFWEFYLCSHQGGLPLTRTGRYFKLFIYKTAFWSFMWIKIGTYSWNSSQRHETSHQGWSVCTVHYCGFSSSPWDAMLKGGGASWSQIWRQRTNLDVLQYTNFLCL